MATHTYWLSGVDWCRVCRRPGEDRQPAAVTFQSLVQDRPLPAGLGGGGTDQRGRRWGEGETPGGFWALLSGPSEDLTKVLGHLWSDLLPSCSWSFMSVKFSPCYNWFCWVISMFSLCLRASVHVLNVYNGFFPCFLWLRRILSVSGKLPQYSPASFHSCLLFVPQLKPPSSSSRSPSSTSAPCCWAKRTTPAS